MIDLDELERLQKDVTPGTLYISDYDGSIMIAIDDQDPDFFGEINTTDDMLYFVSLFNDAPEMIAELRESRARIEKAEAALKLYASRQNYIASDNLIESMIDMDNGATARKYFDEVQG